MQVAPLSSARSETTALFEESRIKTVALRCLKEWGASLLLHAAVGCFMSSAGLTVLSSALVVQCALSLIVHIGNLYDLAAINFSLLTGSNVHTLIHEAGHALAAKLFYQNAAPTIALEAFQGGVTRFHKGSLSALGKALGSPAATFWICLSGPLLSLTVSGVALAYGFSHLKDSPNLSSYCIAWGAMDYLEHALSALNAPFASPYDLGQDFVHLAIFGLPPWAVCATITITPIALYAIFKQSIKSSL